jgi:hypothetical protein
MTALHQIFGRRIQRLLHHGVKGFVGQQQQAVLRHTRVGLKQHLIEDAAILHFCQRKLRRL